MTHELGQNGAQEYRDAVRSKIPFRTAEICHPRCQKSAGDRIDYTRAHKKCGNYQKIELTPEEYKSGASERNTEEAKCDTLLTPINL